VKRRTLVTIAFLALVTVGVIYALFREAASHPTYRAEDQPNLQACLANIPREWRPGSMEYIRAETACQYVHR
jgi:hypothetical protein